MNFPPDWSIWVKIGIPASLEAASVFPTKPSYYNLKILILKYSPNRCSQNESLRKCPQKFRKIFETDIFKLHGFVGNPDADSRLAGIPILTHIDRSGGKFNFENDPYFPIPVWQKFGFCDTSANMADFSAKCVRKVGFILLTSI